MTVVTQQIKAVAQGNGSNVDWPYDFPIPTLADLVVSVVTIASGNVTVINPVNFTVTGLGVATGGTVTYPIGSGTILTTDFYLVVERVVPYEQQTDLTNQGGAYPQDIEDALDYLTYQTQQLADAQARSIVFSVADSVEQTLPNAAARANLLLGFDSNGDPIAVAGIDPSVRVSSAMIPVVTAPTTADALTALGLPGALLDLLIPAGTMWDYSLTTAPTGFVFPFGQACTSLYPVYRAALIAAGSIYGTDGTDPLMPDRRSSVSAGKSNMGGVDNGLLPGGTVLGAALGESTSTIVVGNLPPYTPTGTVAITDPGTYQFNQSYVSGAGPLAGGGSNLVDLAVGSGQINGNVNIATRSGGAITGVYTGVSQGGSSTPVSIVQPTFICNVILKVH